MRPRIQARVVIEQIKYLEEYVNTTEPIVGVLKSVCNIIIICGWIEVFDLIKQN